MDINEINLNIKNALIAHDTRSKNLWRNIKAKATSISKEENIEINEAVCLRAAKNELKQLEQTLISVPEDCTLAAETKQSIEELNFYLPKQLTDIELEQRIKAIVMLMPNGTPFGLMMKECMKELGDVADGKRISQILKNL